ncbi:MAG: ankyrin repeat domain-containing protein [Candidatus Babeliales bacterium]|jgi:ankyrin repeat protein
MKSMMKKVCGALVLSGCVMMPDYGMQPTKIEVAFRTCNDDVMQPSAKRMRRAFDKQFDVDVFTAAKKGALMELWFLLDHSADPDACGQDDTTALVVASAHGNVDIVRLLLKFNAHIDAQDHSGLTALMGASMNGHIAIVKELLARPIKVKTQGPAEDIKVNTPDTDDVTAVITNKGSPILDNGADVNIQNKNGLTALMWAAVRGYAGVVQILLEAGADQDIRDTIPHSNRTALDFARARGHQNVVLVLQNYLGNTLAQEWPECSRELLDTVIKPFLDS